jgi:glucokinase
MGVFMAKKIQIREFKNEESWKVKTLLAGAILGAATGLGAAYLLTKRADEKGEPLSITSGQGLKMGVLIAGLLRSIVTLGEE